jgi:hypothetical protein
MFRDTRLVATLALGLACGQPDAGGPDTDATGSTAAPATMTAAPTTSGADGGATTGEDPFSREPVCSSDVYWTLGNQESPLMHPGVACLACHKTQEPEIADRLAIAGTVYPTGHEPDDCYGADDAAAPIVVEITTADDRILQLPVGPSGNFLYDLEEQADAIAFPIKARVLQGGRVRAMASPQASGDCNGCHTQDGTAGAPGRIVAP